MTAKYCLARCRTAVLSTSEIGDGVAIRRRRSPRRWGYRLFAPAGKIFTCARRTQLPLPESAPEKDLIKLLLDNIARLTKGLVLSTG